jgi:hypothetical protein
VYRMLKPVSYRRKDSEHSYLLMIVEGLAPALAPMTCQTREKELDKHCVKLVNVVSSVSR